MSLIQKTKHFIGTSIKFRKAPSLGRKTEKSYYCTALLWAHYSSWSLGLCGWPDFPYPTKQDRDEQGWDFCLKTGWPSVVGAHHLSALIEARVIGGCSSITANAKQKHISFCCRYLTLIWRTEFAVRDWSVLKSKCFFLWSQRLLRFFLTCSSV